MGNLKSEKEKIEVLVMKTEDGRLLLNVDKKYLEISDFKTTSSAYGGTELVVTIKGATVSTAMSASSGL